jgi:predicted Zn-dependent protease
MTNEAIAEWQKARSLRKDVPGLQRNLGRALLEIKMDAPAAAEVLKEGLAMDPKNSEIAEALQKAQSGSSKLPAAQ